MTDAALRLALLMAFAWLLLVGIMLLLEGRFIYFPSRAHELRPEALGLTAETAWIETGDGVRLHGWWIRGRGRTAIVWYHGNAGNISHRLEQAQLMVNTLGTHLLLVDYRGYGMSAGSPDEAGLYRDGVAALIDVGRRGFRPEHIVLYGESLGAAVAIEVALSHPCAAVILQTPFLSIAELARSHYPYVPPFLIRTKFDNEEKIKRLTVPTWILHGDRDEIVPVAHALRLFDLTSAPKQLTVVPGASHNDLFVGNDVTLLREWGQFLHEHVR